MSNRSVDSSPVDRGEGNSKRKSMTLPDYLLAVFFAATILAVSAQVLFRYVFNNSLTWSEELARYLFSWMIFIGTACAFRDNAHIRLDSIANCLPGTLKKPLNLIVRIVIILFLELAVVLGFQLVLHTSGTQSPALALPVNLVYYASLPAAFMLALYYEIRAVVRAAGLFRADSPNENGREEQP